MIVMTRYANNSISYAPFYIHSFQIVQPHTLVEAETFNICYTAPYQITNTPDRLRWYRYHHGLLQRDVAKFAGIDQHTYSRYEKGVYDYYPIDIMRKIAELFSVSVTELLDEYNLFLYHGQGKQIQILRKFRNMSRTEYAQHLGIYSSTLRDWELDLVRITKHSWELLKDKG